MIGVRTSERNMTKRITVGIIAAAALFLAACSSSTSSDSASEDSAAAPAKTLRIAFLASSSQNGYNQSVWAGIQEQATALGNVEVSIMDGQFAADVQLRLHAPGPAAHFRQPFVGGSPVVFNAKVRGNHGFARVRRQRIELGAQAQAR